MFIPVTFIVEKARAEGMSEHLLNYLVPILNAARYVPPNRQTSTKQNSSSSYSFFPKQHNRPNNPQRPRRQIRPLQHDDPNEHTNNSSNPRPLAPRNRPIRHHRLRRPLRHLLRSRHRPYPSLHKDPIPVTNKEYLPQTKTQNTLNIKFHT